HASHGRWVAAIELDLAAWKWKHAEDLVEASNLPALDVLQEIEVVRPIVAFGFLDWHAKQRVGRCREPKAIGLDGFVSLPGRPRLRFREPELEIDKTSMRLTELIPTFTPKPICCLRQRRDIPLVGGVEYNSCIDPNGATSRVS